MSVYTKCEGGCGRNMANGGTCDLCKAGGTYTPSETHRYFVYDPCGDGFAYFTSLDAAKNWAEENTITWYCDDGWMEEVDQIVVGELTHITKQANVTPSDDPDYAYTCDYVLTPLAASAEREG